MERTIFSELTRWQQDPHRKPLILRGARQVGKTTVVRQLGKQFDSFVELNFEESAHLCDIFASNLDTTRIISDLQIMTGKTISPGHTLLFLDEIQACPPALLALRYLYESIPHLHVIAAGSLLEFAIEEVGLPVGRVSFLYLYPMSFIEFLLALDEAPLAEAILQQKATQPFSDPVHQKALRLLGEYIAIGGMPESVYLWKKNKNYRQCVDVHHDLLTAYRQDFEKYARRSQIKYVEHVFQQIPQQMGGQFRWSNIPGDFRARELTPALELLKKANVTTPIFQTAGWGIPLGAHANPKQFKLITLDIALAQAQLGVTSEAWILTPEKAFINKGTVAEAMVGQELLAYANPRQHPQLFYWHRQKKSSQAEVDYLVSQNTHIIPIEVKSGSGSTLKSLHQFLKERPETPYGIRYSTQNYSVFEKIHSYPLYAVSSIAQ